MALGKTKLLGTQCTCLIACNMQNLAKQNTMIPSLCNYDKLMLWDIHQKKY